MLYGVEWNCASFISLTILLACRHVLTTDYIANEMESLVTDYISFEMESLATIMKCFSTDYIEHLMKGLVTK